MNKIVLGQFAKPTDSQEKLVQLTSGWKLIYLNTAKLNVYWNPAVSIPSNNGSYNINGIIITKYEFYLDTLRKSDE